MAIRQKTSMTIKLSGTGTSHARCEVLSSGLTQVIDEPVARGGTGTGFSPTETVYAALIGCKCADRLGVNIGHMGFEMEVDFDRRGVLMMEEIDVPFTAIRLTVTSGGPATDAELQQVAAETAKFCPISKLYEQAGTDLTVTWRKA